MPKEKESWSCNICGATTTNPEHMLITYFHLNCPGRKAQLMLIRISIYQEVDTDDFELGLNTRDEDISYLVDRFVEDIHTLAKNGIVKEQVEVEYL